MSIARVIIIAAMRGATLSRLNGVEEETWEAIEATGDPEDRLASIHYANDAGVLSLEWKFMSTDNQPLARLLWNEFEHDIEVRSRDRLPKWKLELIDCPRAKKPSELAWHATRLRRANLPRKLARVQLGEIFGGVVEWGDVERNVDAEWDDQENCFRIECGQGEYRGWDPERAIYMGASDTFENNEHVARIAL